MKALKVIAGLLVVLLVVGGIAVYFGVKNLDGIVKTIVEQVGTNVIGTEVSLSDVNITLSEGRAELHGLSIANPDGFSDASALSLGEIALELDLGSIGKDVLVINEILINDIGLLAEQAGSGINLQTLLNSLKSKQGSSQGEAQPAEESGPSDFKLAVKQINFGGGNIALVSDQYGDRDLKLPPLALKDLGSASNGLTPDQLAQAALEPLLAQAKEAVRDHAEAEARKQVEKAIEKKIKEKLDEGDVDKLKSLFK